MIGYGITLSDNSIFDNVTVDDIRNLITKIPALDIKLRKYELPDPAPSFDESDINEIKDYLIPVCNLLYSDDMPTIIGYIIAYGATITDGVRLNIVDTTDTEGAEDRKCMLVFKPNFPWCMTDTERELTQKDIDMVFNKWLSFINVGPVKPSMRII